MRKRKKRTIGADCRWFSRSEWSGATFCERKVAANRERGDDVKYGGTPLYADECCSKCSSCGYEKRANPVKKAKIRGKASLKKVAEALARIAEQLNEIAEEAES